MFRRKASMADDNGDSTLPLVELFVKVIDSEQNIFCLLVVPTCCDLVPVLQLVILF